jgi:hypothetical protein
VGHSPSHSGSVALVLNPCTGHVSPQFHVVFDYFFSMVSYMEKSQVPPNWADLVENSREKVTEEDYNLAKMWLFPEAEVGDITMQDTLNTTTTRTPARENTSTLVLLMVPFESWLFLNSDTFKSLTTTRTSNNNDSIPRPSLNPVMTLAPSLLTDDTKSAPLLINLEMSGLPHSPRITELTNTNSNGPDIVAYSVSTKQSRQMRPKPRLSFLSVFNLVGSFWTFATRDTHSENKQFSYVAQVLHDLDRLNGLFDDTINDICHQIHAFTMNAIHILKCFDSTTTSNFSERWRLSLRTMRLVSIGLLYYATTCLREPK